MEMKDGVVYLKDIRGYTVYENSVSYTDRAGNKFSVPMSLIIRLYEGSKFHMERRNGRDWKEYTDMIMKKEYSDG